MKRLILLASLLLTISATSVQAQNVICEKFGSGQIIANGIWPLGRVKKSEVGSNSNPGGITANLQPIYDQLNNNAGERRERLTRQAAGAEAQRQREYEERMLRLRTQKPRSTPAQRSYAKTLPDEAHSARDQYLERMSAQLDERERSEEQANTSLTNRSSERGSSLVEDLSALGKLHTVGMLTNEDSNAAKRQLLGL